MATGGGKDSGGPDMSRRGVMPFRITLPSMQSAASAAQSSQAATVPVLIGNRQARGPAPSTSAGAASGPSTAGPPVPPTYVPRTTGGMTSGSNNQPQARPPPVSAPQASGHAGQAAPPRPLLAMPSGRHVIAVSTRQRGNPILDHVRNVPYEFVDGLVPDYVLGSYTCALYISLRYHLLHPTYLIRRIKELRNDYRLRVVLCYVDVEDNVKPLHEINRLALLEKCTLLLAWSKEEAGRYLETYKAYESKPTDSIQERVDADHAARLTAAMTTVRSINKTDAMTLATTFGSVRGIMTANRAQLAQCPGLGDKKVQRLWETFHEPFLRKKDAADQPRADLPASYSMPSGHLHGVGMMGRVTGEDPLEWASDPDATEDEGDYA